MIQSEFERELSRLERDKEQALIEAKRAVARGYGKKFGALVAQRIKTLNTQNIEIGDFIKYDCTMIKVDTILYQRAQRGWSDAICFVGEPYDDNFRKIESKSREKIKYGDATISKPIIVKKARKLKLINETKN